MSCFCVPLALYFTVGQVALCGRHRFRGPNRIFMLAFGQVRTITNRSSLPFSQCLLWVGTCVECSKTRKWAQGIFCANFGHCVSTSKTCQSMLCGNCHRSYDEPDFFVATGENMRTGKGDEDRMTSGWARKKSEQSRFRSARDGDDLLVSVECDFCIVGKRFDHEPRATNEKDKYALACFRRINLDWSRACDKVAHNTNKMREGLEIS